MWIDKLIGERMRVQRTKHGIDLNALTQRTGISENVLQAYEAGKTRIQRHDLIKIAQALDVRPEQFFEGVAIPSKGRFPRVSSARDTVRIHHQS